MSRRNARKPRASLGESPRHQNKILLPSPSKRIPRGHISPSKRHQTIREYLLLSLVEFSRASHPPGRPRSRAKQVRHRTSAPAPPEKRCCYSESEMVRAFFRQRLPHLPSRGWQLAAFGRIAIAQRLLAPPRQVRRNLGAFPPRGGLGLRLLQSLAARCSDRVARRVRIGLFRPRLACARSS